MKNKVVVPLLLVSVLFSVFYISMWYTENKLHELNRKFPQIDTDKAVFGRIHKIYKTDPRLFKDNPNSAFITLDDFTTCKLRTGNELTRDSNLDETIKIGMLLIKNEGSNTIELIEFDQGDSIHYYFNITDQLGYEK